MFIYIIFFFRIRFLMIGIQDWCVNFSPLELRYRLNSSKFLGIMVHNRSFSSDVKWIRSCHSPWIGPQSDVGHPPVNFKIGFYTCAHIMRHKKIWQTNWKLETKVVINKTRVSSAVSAFPGRNCHPRQECKTWISWILLIACSWNISQLMFLPDWAD